MEDINKEVELCKQIEVMAKRYNLDIFIVTKNLSYICNNSSSESVSAAKLAHLQWEMSKYIDK
jgi:hypothetical protein